MLVTVARYSTVSIFSSFVDSSRTESLLAKLSASTCLKKWKFACRIIEFLFFLKVQQPNLPREFKLAAASTNYY